MTSNVIAMLFLLVSCSANRSTDCSRAKEGRFIDVSGGGRSEILRTASEQIEKSVGQGEMRLRIRWVDKCTYQLFDRRMISGAEPSFPKNPADTITVRILSSDEEGFTYEAETDSMHSMKGHQLYGK